MHYKNGREAKNGDKVVCMPSWGAPSIGILYDAVASNGRLAQMRPTDQTPNLKECLHLEDVQDMLVKFVEEAPTSEAAQ